MATEVKPEIEKPKVTIKITRVHFTVSKMWNFNNVETKLELNCYVDENGELTINPKNERDVQFKFRNSDPDLVFALGDLFMEAAFKATEIYHKMSRDIDKEGIE